MVSDLFEASMVYTFIEELLEPLCGLVKSRRPSMLQEAVLCARQGASPRLEHHFLHEPLSHKRGIRLDLHLRGPHRGGGR